MADYITHYYLPDRKPFLNLSDLSGKKLKDVLDELNQKQLDGSIKRIFPDWYLSQREEAEKNLLKSFIKKGGKPDRKSPHYFCLGKSKGIEFGFNNNFKTIELPISLIKKEIMFSLGDTLFTFSKSYNDKIKWENEWYQGKLYNYEETIQIIEQLNLDLNDTESLHKNKIACIEGMIWSDKILKKALLSQYNSTFDI